MKFQLDHDLHIHTQLSPCSGNPEQTPERILQHGVEHNLKHMVLTDHFWDETVPGNFVWDGYDCISRWLPLPQAEKTQMHFGCEADMNMAATIGISKETAQKFDFIVVPTTHMNFIGGTIRKEDVGNKKALACRYIERWDALLNADLPFHKIGIAHLTCRLLAGLDDAPWTDHIDILDTIPNETFQRMFAKTEQVGIGVELNVEANQYAPDELERILRIYRIAAECGCHFYCGSDAHHPGDLEIGYKNSLYLIDKLNLDEEQKFNPFRESV